MKIILYRHAAPDFRPARRLSAAEFDAERSSYAAAPLLPVPEEARVQTDRPIYVSPSPLTQKTAEALFGRTDYTVTPLLAEIPERSFADTSLPLPRALYRLMARLQWYAGSSRQEESRAESKARVRALTALLEREGRDCVLIGHGRFLRFFMTELAGPEYETRGGQGGLGYLEKAAVVPREPHCGSCGHNCPLSRPGCLIGREKAAALGRRAEP